MFASGFQGPVKEFIKDAKTDEEIPIPKLNKCGMIVYFLAVSVGLITFICYLTLASFQTESSTIGKVFIEGQNCSILSTFSGVNVLGTTVYDRVKIKNSLSSIDKASIKSCILQTCPEIGTAFTAPEDGKCLDPKKVGPDKIKLSYGHVTSMMGQFTSTCKYATYDECITDKYTGTEPPAVKALLNNFGSNGLMFSKDADTESADVPNGKGEGEYTKAGIEQAYLLGGSLALLEIKNSFQSVYYESEQKCLADLKLVSADMVETEEQIEFVNYSGDPNPQGSVLIEQKINSPCYMPVKFRQVDYKFSAPGLKFSFGPSLGLTYYYSNLVCNQGTSPGTIATCGYLTKETYNPADQMKAFELIFPDWKASACSLYRDLTPIQCIKTETPSVVTAAANSLALFNSFLGGLFLLACYLMSNGYDVYSYLFEGKKKAVDAATASDEKDEDTKTKPQEEVEASTIQSNPMTMTTNPMTSEA